MSNAGDNAISISMRYEDYVREPEARLDAIMSFLGLEREEVQLDPNEIGRDPRSARREFERLSRPIDDASVGRWQTLLEERDIRAFERVAGAALTQFGYALRGSSD